MGGAALVLALHVCGCRSRLLTEPTFDLAPPPGDLSLSSYTRVHTDVPGCSVAAIVHGDFDLDGKDDLALGCDPTAPAGIFVLVGHGDGSYDVTEPLADVTPFPRLAAAALGPDDRPDVVGVAPGFSRFVVLIDGAHGWGSIAKAVNGSPAGLALADFDGDGHVDLAMDVVTNKGPVVEWTSGDGTGAFAIPKQLTLVEPGLRRMAARDLDGDGHVDLAIGSDAPHVTLLAGDGKGGFAPLAQVSIPDGATAADVLAAADLDGDGLADLLVAGVGAGVYVVADHGGLAARRIGSPAAMNDGAIGDVDGDGRPDVVIADGQAAFVLRQASNGSYLAGSVGPVPGASSVTVGDEDGDGLNDIVVGSNGGVDVFVQRSP